jgi:acyl-CoA reductase-like NAD-dependent aldehyde dehydrogenase
LNAIGEELMARSAELGRELSREEGKPLAEGVGEVYRSGQFFTYYAAEVHRQMGDTADSVRPGIEIDIRRETVGVVGVISPWNFPMATAVDTFFCLLLLIDFTCFKSPIRPPCWRQTHNLRQGDPNGTGPA